MVFEAAQRVGILFVLAVILVFVWHLGGRDRWVQVLTERFVWGVPWGSLLTIAGVVAFYLFAQSGIEAWSDPAVVPFRSWSYSYLTGMLSAGFAHAGPNHLISNMLGAVVLSPLVEYAWGHYPPARRRVSGVASQWSRYPPPGASSDGKSGGTTPEGESPAGTDDGGFLDSPWVRAVVIFPLAIIAVSILTSVLALGWSLGYSGTVYALLGFALVMLPLTTVVAVVVTSGVNVIFSALWEPVYTVSADPGGPAPPSWAGINVQAHLLGFLLGVVLALALLRYRDQWPDVERVAFAVVLVVLARSLWLLPTSSGDEFTQWRAIGVIFALSLAFVIIATVAMDDRQVLGAATLRDVLLGALVVITLVIALPSVAANLPGMADDPVSGEDGIDIQDYTVTYAENASHGRVDSEASGVIVVSEQRVIWTTAVGEERLAHDGSASVTVGGIGWREVVDVERTGWDVLGNDSAYAVDLSHDGRDVRPFVSDPVASESTIANRTVAVVPREGSGERFGLAVNRSGERVAELTIPDVNEMAAAGGLTFATEDRDGSETVFAESNGTRVRIAQRE